MTQFGLYSNFKMTPQEVNRVANLLEWTTVLEVMIKSRRANHHVGWHLERRSKNGGTNERKIDRCIRVCCKNIEALASMHRNLSKQKRSGQCRGVAG